MGGENGNGKIENGEAKAVVVAGSCATVVEFLKELSRATLRFCSAGELRITQIAEIRILFSFGQSSPSNARNSRLVNRGLCTSRIMNRIVEL